MPGPSGSRRSRKVRPRASAPRSTAFEPSSPRRRQPSPRGRRSARGRCTPTSPSSRTRTRPAWRPTARPRRPCSTRPARCLRASPRCTPLTSPTPTSSCSGRTGCAAASVPRPSATSATASRPPVACAEAGARLSLGTDSHAAIDMFEEARAVELDERLATGARGLHRAADLLRAATENGHASLGWPEAGRIAPGALADLTTVGLDSAAARGNRAGARRRVDRLRGGRLGRAPRDGRGPVRGPRWRSRRHRRRRRATSRAATRRADAHARARQHRPARHQRPGGGRGPVGARGRRGARLRRRPRGCRRARRGERRPADRRRGPVRDPRLRRQPHPPRVRRRPLRGVRRADGRQALRGGRHPGDHGGDAGGHDRAARRADGPAPRRGAAGRDHAPGDQVRLRPRRRNRAALLHGGGRAHRRRHLPGRPRRAGGVRGPRGRVRGARLHGDARRLRAARPLDRRVLRAGRLRRRPVAGGARGRPGGGARPARARQSARSRAGGAARGRARRRLGRSLHLSRRCRYRGACLRGHRGDVPARDRFLDPPALPRRAPRDRGRRHGRDRHELQPRIEQHDLDELLHRAGRPRDAHDARRGASSPRRSAAPRRCAEAMWGG